MSIESLCQFIGSLVCHQIQKRMLIIDGIPLPVCARDTGIYLGVIAGIVFLALTHRLRAGRPPALKYTLALTFAMIPMMIDGVLSYIGIRGSDNLTRLITGGFFGLPLCIFLMFARNYKPEQHNEVSPINTWKELITLVLALIICMALVYKGIFLPWIVVSLTIISGIVTMFYLIIDSIVSFFRFKSKNTRIVVSLMGMCCIFIFLYLLNRVIFLTIESF